MSRRRYISTEISTDTAVNRLAMKSDFAALLYTWMIPHCGDDACIPADAEEILLLVMPGRRDKTPEDIEEALRLMQDFGLIHWDDDGKSVNYPPEAFYKYQSYIKDGARRGAHNSAEQRTDDDNSAKQRNSAQNSASFKSSVSLSSSVSVSVPSPSSETRENTPQPPTGERVRPIKPLDLSGFEEFYELFPRHVGRDPAEKAWAKLSQDERAAAIAAIRQQITWSTFTDVPPDKIPHPTTWLNQRRWTDEPPKPSNVQPIRSVTRPQLPPVMQPGHVPKDGGLAAWRNAGNSGGT